VDDSSRPSGPVAFGLPWIRTRIEQRVPASSQVDSSWLSTIPPPPQASASTRRAAVAAILREAIDGPEVLLIRRAEHPRDPWSGHMAFPGGREDPGDPDLLDTAVRETREELALDLTKSGRLIGRLDDIPAVARGRRTGMSIAPFVFELTSDVPFTPNYEVAEALWAPLLPFMRGDLLTTIPYELEGRRIDLPAHNYQGRIVWGLTFKMLDNLFALLR